MELKLPPRIKIMEALGAVADGRVKLTKKGAIIKSSSSAKEYEVMWDGERNQVNSTDHGTQKGYVGYPILAMLMLNGTLPYDARLGNLFKNIEWRPLIERYKNYSQAMDEVLKDLKWEDKKKFFRFSKWIFTILKDLKIKKLESEPKLTDFLSDEIV